MFEIIWRRGVAVYKVLLLHKKPYLLCHMCSSNWYFAGRLRWYAARSVCTDQCMQNILYILVYMNTRLWMAPQSHTDLVHMYSGLYTVCCLQYAVYCILPVYWQQRWKQNASAGSCGANRHFILGPLALALCCGYLHLSSYTPDNSVSFTGLSPLKLKTLYCLNWSIPLCQGQNGLGGMFVSTNELTFYGKKTHSKIKNSN